MARYTINIKEWFLHKIEETSGRYNTFIDAERDENGMRKVVDGYVTVVVEEKIGESEKAIHVQLATGEVVGSGNGWKCWIPKSVIA